MAELEVYLEYQGQQLALTSPFKIGRSKSCGLPLDDSQVSREHAMIVFDLQSAKWSLTDLGSTNGTYLNGKRLTGTERLKSSDSFSIGKQRFTFREPGAAAIESTLTTGTRTMISIEKDSFWLVLADVKNSTKLSQELPPGEASLKIRQWIDECRQLLERAQCTINEYLGDGFLAVSRHHQTTPEAMASMVEQFAELKSVTGLEFRLVIHFGEMQTGAGVSSGVEKLSGKELNYAFKSEKAISHFNTRINLTESAFGKLRAVTACKKIGEVQIGGFEGTHGFYTWSGRTG